MMSAWRQSLPRNKWATITSALTGQSPVQTVPACPVQIRAHHHIDVYTDINHVFAVNTKQCIRRTVFSGHVPVAGIEASVRQRHGAVSRCR